MIKWDTRSLGLGYGSYRVNSHLEFTEAITVFTAVAVLLVTATVIRRATNRITITHTPFQVAAKNSAAAGIQLFQRLVCSASWIEGCRAVRKSESIDLSSMGNVGIFAATMS